jgi:hypothetical protein
MGGVLSRRSRAQLAALVKVQAKLSLREPSALGAGVGLPAVLLVVFGVISRQVAGNVGGSGLTVIDLYIPVVMVISFIAIAISLPNTLVRDREIGWLRRISTTPVHPSRLLAAQLILDLVLAAVAIVIVIVGGTVIFGAPLTVGIPFFILSLALAIARSSRWDWWSWPWPQRRPWPVSSAGCSSSPCCSCPGCGSSRSRPAHHWRTSCGIRPAARRCGLFSTRCST